MVSQFKGANRDSSVVSQGTTALNLTSKLDLHRFSLPNNEVKGSLSKHVTSTPSKKKLVKTAALTSTN